MQDVGYAALQIIPSFKDLDRHLETGTAGALTAAGTRGGVRFGDAAGRSAGHRFASAFSHIARAGVIGLLGGTAILGTAAFKLAGNSLEEAREAQKVGGLTVAVIKSTGGAAKVTAKEVGDLAEALSNKTGVDDEVIQRGANMLLTFKNVRNEVGKTNDIFNQSVAVAEDMAAAMAGGSGGDLDLKSSSILVGKALNDPIKGLTALTRVGVTFTEGQKKQIENLVESGKRMEAQKLILGELKSEFGGAAAAQATMADKVKVAWGNIEERLGKALLPMVNDLQRAFLKKGVPAIEGWVDAFEKKGIPALKHFYEKAKPVVEKALPEIKEALGTVKDVAKETLPFILDLVEAFNDLPKWAKFGIVGGGMAAKWGSRLGLGSMLGRGGAGGLIAASRPIPVFVTNQGFGGGMGGAGGGRGGLLKGAGGLALGAAGYLGLNEALHASGAVPDRVIWTPIGPIDVKQYEDAGAAIKRAFEGMKGAGTITSLGPLRSEAERTAAAFAKFPDALQTELIVKGGPESRREVMDLVRTYDLTPREKRTLFETYNIPDAKRTVNDYKGVLGSVPEKESTNFSIYGIESAQAKLNQAARMLQSLDGRTYRTVLELHTVRTGAGGQGLGYNGAAGGGTVPKTGMGYADRHPYLLADGEEVISNRYGQADRYRSLLKAINANRRLADGGTAGTGRGGSVVVERVIERLASNVTIQLENGQQLRGFVRGEANSETSADRRFDSAHVRGYDRG